MVATKKLERNLADVRAKYPCPVCIKDELVHDEELNCFHCLSCLYQWHPSDDYPDKKRFITNPSFTSRGNG